LRPGALWANSVAVIHASAEDGIVRILILGGSRFLGRAFAAEALAAGHRVTVFNRGKSGPDLPGVQAVRGDRENPADLERLAGRSEERRVGKECRSRWSPYH